MKLLIAVPMFGETNFEGGTSKLGKAYIQSAKTHGIKYHPYGVDENYTDWIQVKSTRLIQYLQGAFIYGYFTHVLYTDGFDVVWNRPYKDIHEAYNYYDRPNLLVASEKEPYPNGNKWNSEGGRYINAGGFMGPIDQVLDALEYMREAFGHLSGNDQEWWQLFWKLFPSKIILDHESKLMQCMSGGDYVMGKKYDACCLHFNGMNRGTAEEYLGI